MYKSKLWDDILEKGTYEFWGTIHQKENHPSMSTDTAADDETA